MPILTTKLYIPPPRPKVIQRPRLIERLNEGMHGKLTLVSASAGFGKTTLVSEWVAGCRRPAAWLSLDEGDDDPSRFLSYLIAAIRTIRVNIGEGLFGALQSPQPPIESILTNLINEITAAPDPFILVLDDYHMINAKPVDNILIFLLEHLPPQMHLVIATRMDPDLPLARLRVRGQLTELRAADMRFNPTEAAGFLTQVMSLKLSSEEIILLETRTEGWIAGLQLAAISLQGHKDAASFIKSFTGSHRFVLDYLVEEVLQQQSESIQTFLLYTSILDRMCGSLCDAVLSFNHDAFGQETLKYLEHANLFIVPLDSERRWYRYHHLFADLLRQRIHQTPILHGKVADLHRLASVWYEENGLELEAFHHAAAANDVDRAARLMEGGGMPLHFRGAVTPVLKWLKVLPAAVLDARPSLWVMYGSALLMVGQMNGVERKLLAAEAALQAAEQDDNTRDLIGHIASVRAALAVSQHQIEIIIAQSHRALKYLHPGNLPVRTATIWTLGYAYQLQGNRAAASEAYTEAISISEAIGHMIITISATIGLGNLQEADNQLDLAVQTYLRVLQLAGDPPLPIACEAHLGLARIFLEWNDMDRAAQHAERSIRLAQQIENTDRSIACEAFLARLKLAQRDAAGAEAILAKASQLVIRYNFAHQMHEVAAAQVHTLLRLGNLTAAAHLVHKHDLPMSQARVHLAQGEAARALAALGRLLCQAEERGWEDERLKVMVLQAIALHMLDDKDKALQKLSDALSLAEKGGFIRIFIDEGTPMAGLLSEAIARGIKPDYASKLQAVIKAEEQKDVDYPHLYLPLALDSQSLIEPLSQRELEVLRLIAQGLSNLEISERLFLALSTVKGHNRNIFDKLLVQRRTEAVARARELNLL